MKVCEIFRSIQGESYLAGYPCTFVRLAGCNLACPWCDTKYALSDENASEMSVAEIVMKVRELGTDLVEVTGGEPLVQEDSIELMHALCDANAKVMLETNGSLDIAPVDPRVIVIMDIKAPSSGHVDTNRWENLDLLQDTDEVKVVIADRADYEWARSTLSEKKVIGALRTSFSPVFSQLDYNVLAEWLKDDQLNVRLGFQLHKIIWGQEARGV